MFISGLIMRADFELEFDVRVTQRKKDVRFSKVASSLLTKKGQSWFNLRMWATRSEWPMTTEVRHNYADPL
jgi:hypothetical protein